MNLVDELKALDVNDVGRWPLIFRVAVIVIVFVAVLSTGTYFFIIEDKLPQLQREKQTELDLRTTFENKQRKAANYDAYKAQLAQMEQSFGTMLRQLPGETEIPSLIVDISQAGLAAGLKEKLFQPQPEVPKDFYAEKPIKIILSGGYHEIANFVSGVAALPRIVTLHNINITPDDATRFDRLTLETTAKTYRYIEEAE
ncbi:MAG: type 4a pilus biogenesis protein PilO [Gammaproteobacteria bacterium]|nr:type 4a pilus biogenesis protein PilO [Gammaproteobacteria bacterium]MDH4314400.1 type 4a pilus biogenesis protein PilO [Gammaproteobacteria bacterium]MDH5213184.1 type 4a pilus biogenesis protein PilO [Gammaproteobacteria bacterium]MDH5501268.1 type 4a pilus biogenesis protein PilO [Gammaproteobacteria bacterium]